MTALRTAVIYRSSLALVLQSFCFFAQGTLLFQVFVHTFLQALEELSLFTEELVARFAETFENLHVHFLRSETNGFPFVLLYLTYSEFVPDPTYNAIRVVETY